MLTNISKFNKHIIIKNSLKPLRYLPLSLTSLNNTSAAFITSLHYPFTTQLPIGQGRKRPQQYSDFPQKPDIPIQSIIFPYPFEFTLQANNFKYYDPRFTQQPIKRNLQSGQKQHILFVLENLQAYMNGYNNSISGNIVQQINKGKNNNSNNNIKYNNNKLMNHLQLIKPYINKLMEEKLNMFLLTNKQSKMYVKVKFDKYSIQKTQGYLQMQSKSSKNNKNNQQSTKIDFLSPKYIHEYRFQRQKQLILISQVNKKQQKSQQQQLQQDITQLMNQKSNKKQVKQFLSSIQKPTSSDSDRAVNFLMSKLKSLASKQSSSLSKKRQQQTYLISDFIKGKMLCEIIYENKVISNEIIEVYTKWMYIIKGNEPESIKKSRKRVLYDFQFWNRGVLFPIKNFVDGVL